MKTKAKGRITLVPGRREGSAFQSYADRYRWSLRPQGMLCTITSGRPFDRGSETIAEAKDEGRGFADHLDIEIVHWGGIEEREKTE